MKRSTKRAMILVSALVVTSAVVATSHSRWLGSNARCPDTPSERSCTSASWASTGCGRLASKSGSCESICDGRAISDSQCGDPAFLSSICGQIEVAAWEQAIEQQDVSLSLCAAHRVHFDRNGKMTWRTRPRSAPEPVLEPSEVCSDGSCSSQPGTLVGDATKIESTSSMGHSGSYTTMRGFRRRMHAATGVKAALHQMRLDQWQDNDGRVDSCEEYVYEKYYDYTLFEDKTLGSGDFRRYMDVGYASQFSFYGASAKPGAIGRMGVLGDPMSSKDGTPIEPQPDISRSRRKNIFYIAPPATGAAGTAPYWRPADLPYLSEIAKTGCGGNIYEINTCDPAISQARFAGRDQEVVESWDFHLQMSLDMAAAGFLDEELYRADQLKDEFAHHLNLRGQAVRELLEYMGVFQDWSPAVTLKWPSGWQNDWQAGGPLDLANPIGQVLELSRVRSSEYGSASPLVPAPLEHHLAELSQLAGQPVGLRGGSASQSQAIAAQGALRRYAAYGVSYARSASAPITSSDSAAGPMSPSYPALGGGIGRLTELMEAVVEADYVLEQDLLAARALGCLPDDPDQLAPCDWSPRDFAQSVTDLYSTEREADYARCQESTASIGFDQIPGRQLSIMKEVDGVYEAQYPMMTGQQSLGSLTSTYYCALNPFGEVYENEVPDQSECLICNLWNRSTTHLDQYFSCLSAYKKLLFETLEELGPLQDETGALQLASSSSDYEQMGDSQWNMYYGYGMGWSVGQFDSWVASNNYSNTCALQPEVYGHFKVGATGLGRSVDVIKASAHIRTGNTSTAPGEVKQDQLYVEVAGVEFANESTKVDANFNIVRGTETSFKDFVYVKVPFALGPIPMSISGGVAGAIGINYSVDAELACDNKGITGTFSPFASINGYATLAIDALIAEAGVKISLTIIRADLPFTVSAALTGSGDQALFTVESNLDLVLSTLGGYFAVYLRIITETWEWQLFSWDGLRYAENLFNHRFSVPIADVARVVSEL